MKRSTFLRVVQHYAPQHIVSSVKCLSQQFNDRVIVFHFTFSWPQISAILTPMDFSDWYYLKLKMYKFNIQTACHLKKAIRCQVHEFALVILRSSALSPMPETKCHCVRGKSCGKFVKHNCFAFSCFSVLACFHFSS